MTNSNSRASIGFLSPELAEDTRRIRADFVAWFEVAEELNRLAMRVVPALQPATDSNDGLVVALLFGRALTTFQGVLILAERGMLADARTLVRGASEAAIVLGVWAADGLSRVDGVESDDLSPSAVVRGARGAPEVAMRA